jgi:ABC-2 type transport system ATP-binding protein
MIRAEGLTRSFGGSAVVRDVSFEVRAGEVVGFLGPNGAGKTTTIRMLLGLLRPSSGTALLDRPVGYLPETFSGYESLSVAAYLRFWCRVRRLDATTEIPEALAATDLSALARRPIRRLSKGQRQRVGLAQAVLGSPRSLVLDEPTIGLDPSQLVDARRLMRAAADDGAAVLFSTHLLAEASAVCDRIVVVVGGRVVAEERPGSATDLEERFLRLVGAAELSGTGSIGEPVTDAEPVA